MFPAALARDAGAGITEEDLLVRDRRARREREHGRPRAVGGDRLKRVGRTRFERTGDVPNALDVVPAGTGVEDRWVRTGDFVPALVGVLGRHGEWVRGPFRPGGGAGVVGRWYRVLDPRRWGAVVGDRPLLETRRLG